MRNICPMESHTETGTPRNWLITGCSSGLGLALAEAALQAGDRVLATARNPENLSCLETEFPGTCRTAPLDLTCPSHIPAAVETALAAFGRIDVLVNNAGFGVVGALEEIDAEQVARNFQVNFFGALELIRAALPSLRAQGSGHIVNISAAAAIANYPGFSVYGATKWALEGASESLAAEIQPLGLRVTLVEPGPFRTEFIGRSLERARGAIDAYAPTSGKFLKLLQGMQGRQPGDPAKAAHAILAAVQSPNPPLRLVLGKYAHDKRRKQIAALEAELSTWQAIGQPTEFGPR
jgi:NAD(P)-dependent dehydrogenase (short-subunit alcohol dehydrogenase family)